MARVLVFANHNSTLFNFRRELLSRLVAEQYSVTVALPAHERNQAFKDLGCDVIEIPLSRFGTNPVRELSTQRSFLKVLRNVSPDVVLTYTAKPNIYGGLAAQFCGVPYISTVTGLGAAFQTESLVRRITSLLQRWAYRRASRVFFQNADNLDTFQRIGVVQAQGSVLPGSGVNLELHRLEPYAPDDGLTRFVTVARIRSDKGFDELFEVIKRVCARRSDVEFHIVGWYEDDSYRDAVSEIAADHPVVVHGSVSPERVHEILSQSHALIHPTHHEGMANAVLEAAATGIPCLATNIPGCREAIKDGVTGLLYPVRQADALEAAVMRFLELSWDERRAMGLAGHHKMASEFDREGVVDQYLGEIRRALVPAKQKERV
jgi:galacturonosyltransferase